MKKEIYEYITDMADNLFSGKSYILEHPLYEDYFDKTGKVRDKRRKYFFVDVALRDMRKFDTMANTRIVGEAMVKMATIMEETDKQFPDEDFMFNGCSYTGEGVVKLRVGSIANMALAELVSGSGKIQMGSV